MKKIIAIGILSFAFSTSINAQEKEKGTQRVKLVKVEKSKATPIKKEEPKQEFASPEEEISWCESQIEALNTKEEWINNNPEEKTIAEENGWFTEAEASRVVLRARINELKTKK